MLSGLGSEVAKDRFPRGRSRYVNYFGSDRDARW
jgi:hypothetical protein